MTADKPLRVLVVDDTVIFRKTVSDILMELPGVEVVGIAHNGKIAISKISSLNPDLLTLDIEMPEVNGLEVLEYIRKGALDVGAIILSTLTHEGGEMTIKALELGAFDFIPKPQGNDMKENRRIIKNTLAPMLKAYARRKEIKSILKDGPQPAGEARTPLRHTTRPSSIIQRMGAITGKRGRSEIVAIGVSTGGPTALSKMLPEISPNLGVPVLIVQHMPPIFTQSLANSLNTKCAMKVKEAVDGESVQPNMVFIAPGGKQMKVAAGADGKSRIIRITDDPPEKSCKPSVDYLFKSVAQHYVGRATGVIMTGMGSDGLEGLKQMKKNGAIVIAQDETSCVVYGMSKEPIESGIVDIVAPLDKIAGEITRTAMR